MGDLLSYLDNLLIFSQNQSPTMVGVHFALLFQFLHFFIIFWQRTTRYSNTTDRRNSMNQTSSEEGFHLVPDPDGFLG